MNIEAFKKLVMSSDNVEEVSSAGIELAANINCPADELGSNLGFTLYCNEPSLCDSLGLYDLEDLDADVREISGNTAANYDDVRQRLHDDAQYGVNTCFYSTSPTFMVCDLTELEKFFA